MNLTAIPQCKIQSSNNTFHQHVLAHIVVFQRDWGTQLANIMAHYSQFLELDKIVLIDNQGNEPPQPGYSSNMTVWAPISGIVMALGKTRTSCGQMPFMCMPMIPVLSFPWSLTNSLHQATKHKLY
jgi:hypothetical protein